MRLRVFLAAAASILVAAAARADTGSELRQVYADFAAAQNARDLDRLKPLLLDRPDFLWVSDGKSIWGRDAVLARMARFQTAEIWHNTPDLDHAVAVDLAEGSALLHVPVALTIGPRATPGTYRFLVTMVCVRTGPGWRVAALLTTTEKPD